MKKVYYKIEFELASPLIVGCGTDYVTDNDVNLNSNERPYIPGSAIAGVLRHSIEEKVANEIFGETNGEAYTESSIITYDANVNGWYRISIRDGVALDEHKVAKAGAKMDFQVVETGAKFTTFLEVSDESDIVDKCIPQLFSFMQSSACHFGAKTTRGYGQIKVINIGHVKFDMSSSADIEKWLDFDMYTSEDWQEYSEALTNENDSYDVIRIALEQEGGISIRKYSTDVGKDEEDANGPDFVQLTVKDQNGKETPVVPGTSWAGAFRSRMKEYWDSKNDEAWFGSSGQGEDGKKTKSNIFFSETMLKDAKEKINTRNAIDRFSGGSLDSALFKEKTYYYGNGELVITIKKDEDLSDQVEALNHALAATLTDLNYGFLAVGGLTSIGRGLFKIQKVTKNANEPLDLTDAQNNVYKSIKQYLDK